MADPGDPAADERRYPSRQRRPPGQFWVASTALGEVREPNTVKEALSSPQAADWQSAMDEEMHSLISNGTWILEQPPPGAKVIPVKWIYKVKRGPDGRIERYKARLVAKGFKQVEGIDFNEVYAPVSKHTTLRAFLAMVAREDMELDHLDVKTAFLNGDLEETIYMQQPPGYEQGAPGVACRLLKSLYGLRQAPRAWHLKLKDKLESMDFKVSSADPGLYILDPLSGPALYLAVYVDDILPASKSKALMADVKAKLMKSFDTRDLGPATQFLGMQIVRNRSKRTLTLSQERMTAEILNKYGLSDARPRSVPISAGTQLIGAKSDDELLDTAQFGYAELVGSLLYLSVCTRPDIAQAVGALSRFMSKPTPAHWSVAKSLLRYLAGTIDYGIFFKPDQLDYFVGHCDADYAGDLDTRRSTIGYVFTFHGAAISWSSRLQPTVAASTAEAEYMSASAAVKEALWLMRLFAELGYGTHAVNLFSDNQAALSLMKHPITSAKSKHIDVLYHFARERVSRGEIVVSYCPTAEMVADCMTKPLPPAKFVYCRDKMGVKKVT